MALSATKFVCFICVLTFFSVQIQARESQFFSKIPSSNSGNNYVQVTPDNNNKEELSLSKQQQQEAKPSGFVPETQKQQEPSFIPETQNGYGLYGQQNNNQFPTSVYAADVKYEPHTTPVTSTPTGTFESYTTNPATNSATVKYEPYTTPITSTATGTLEPYSTTLTTGYYNNNGYETEQESMGSSKFRESGYTSSNNVEKQQQGMSDTRYLENGKYYYDFNNNKNNYYYYANEYQQQQLLQHRNSGDPQHKPYVWENTPPIHGHDNEENELP